MLRLELVREKGKPFRILCLGAHSDDIEIGCGGTILQLLRSHTNIEVSWVVLSATPARAREARRSAGLFLTRAAAQDVVVKNFKDSHFPQVSTGIKQYFERLKAGLRPDVVFTHYGLDRHQDHRVVSELTWNTFRDALILEYEVPKYDGDLGTPNAFMGLPRAVVQEKVRLIMKVFPSQAGKDWFTSETFLALPRLRGVESRSGYAEAFYSRKLVLG